MKRLIYFLAALVLTSAPASGQVLTPFIAYTRDLVGSVKSNTVTIEAWNYTNTITGVSTNLVLNYAATFTPRPSDGFFAGYLAPGNYRLTVDGLSRGIVFGMPSSSSTQNLAQLAGVPVYAFMNFTIAQFSDAGTAAYSNAASFFLSSAAGTAAYSNAAAFVTPAQWTNLYDGYCLAVSNLYLGAFTGNGPGLTNLQPTAFTSGTNGIGETVVLLSNFVNRSQSQTISGGKTFTGAILASNETSVLHAGTVYATNLHGRVGGLTNGYWNGGTINASGTNLFTDIAFRRYSNSSLVSGDNAGVLVGTNTFIVVSGPGAAFTIHGFNGSPNRGGHRITVLNKTGHNMTIAHESGTEPTAANRIVSMTGTNRATTGNGVAELIYDASESRWQLTHLDP